MGVSLAYRTNSMQWQARYLGASSKSLRLVAGIDAGSATTRKQMRACIGSKSSKESTPSAEKSTGERPRKNADWQFAGGGVPVFSAVKHCLINMEDIQG